FRSKDHEIAASAPMVIKDDPTLMFTNAGMNQFKDIFLGNRQPKSLRIANSQKCLRVSGKHNDLEEVGHDTYHHTMFEMLGNWSFGDYFKKEAVEWAWEFLTQQLGIPRDRLYATIFEGSPEENVPRDDEAFSYWEKCLGNQKNRILEGSKKDNFWEMGDTGPCGPCSEIHVDIRDEKERTLIPGHELINTGHPLVIEIWNLVFIQYNRKADGSLEPLPAKHVDTGMGFERLCMVVQGKKSNYDTDIFQSLITELGSISGKKYGVSPQTDIAMRVVADHLRAVAFSIADGQIPSNNKAGYVIRRILRRAIRYGYNYLGAEEPFIYRLVPALVKSMGESYPELKASEKHIATIIREEEASFLKTLGKGLKMTGRIIAEMKQKKDDLFPGKIAFELYDTYGFPVDLTRLILKENGLRLDMQGFESEMAGQKQRSRDTAVIDAGDWIMLRETEGTVFTGYDNTEDDVLITKYRNVKVKGKEVCHIVLNRTPFYAESGGQVGDSGFLSSEKEKITITDTVKENDLIIHIATRAPEFPEAGFRAVADPEKRMMTAANHTATHLLHHALRSVLGSHVEQKGSLVTPERLRFDFSHYNKIGKDELARIEMTANRLVMQNLSRKVTENVALEKAKEMGAMALFGEKYGETVRVIGFGDSVELCGGTHVESTSGIGLIKIVSEGAIAAGIRRIEAVTGVRAYEYINEKLAAGDDVAALLKTPGDIREAVEKLLAENSSLKKTIEKFQLLTARTELRELERKAENIGSIKFMSGLIDVDSADMLKTIAFEARKSSGNCVLVIGSATGEKANIVVMVSDTLVESMKLSAVDIIKKISSEINGGGGGQPFLANAGGKNPAGIPSAIQKAKEYLLEL
ncbi:MAG: alanine--tRNA ligase, partial [Bacteroidales bacterium]|nr:alanine--tRNA ligase [Bacteroidales bacterium]